VSGREKWFIVDIDKKVIYNKYYENPEIRWWPSFSFALSIMPMSLQDFTLLSSSEPSFFA
jgi:hypothetical protein